VAFRTQSNRPNQHYPDLHYRALFLPEDDDKARFVWLRYHQNTNFSPSKSEVDELIQGPYERKRIVRKGYEHQRLEIIGIRSSSPDASQNNKALAKLLCWEDSGAWRGNILIRGFQQEEFEMIEGIDDEEIDGKLSRVRAPVDCDTRDLACVLEYIRTMKSV
jgi:hypothetical protein